MKVTSAYVLWNERITSRNIIVSALLQECQIVTELPAGGGDNGIGGGSSVGVGPGVPVPLLVVGEAIGDPPPGAVALPDLGVGVRVGACVPVPGYSVMVGEACVPVSGGLVAVNSGPGYSSVPGGGMYGV